MIKIRGWGGKIAAGGAKFDLVTINKIDSLTTRINEYNDEFQLEFSLGQNYPNSFNPSTEIKYSLAEQSIVRIVLYDILGRKIRDLFVGEQNPGLHEITYNASNLSSGAYIYSIEADYKKGIYKSVKKMILLK